jgi:hypothetical protein
MVGPRTSASCESYVVARRWCRDAVTVQHLFTTLFLPAADVGSVSLEINWVGIVPVLAKCRVITKTFTSDFFREG